MLFSVGINAAAGPSRMGLSMRALSSVARPQFLPSARLLSTRTFPTRPTPTRTVTLNNLTRAGLQLHPRFKSTARFHPSAFSKQWPWYKVEPPLKAGTDEVERVIYSRPVTGDPKVIWAFYVAWFTVVAIYTIMPWEDVREAAQKNDPQPVKYTLGIPDDMLMSYVTGGFVACFTLGFAAAVLFPSRVITRLALVRQKPHGAPASEAKEFIRLTHQGHATLYNKTPLGKPRELPIDKIKMGLVMGRPDKDGVRERQPYLKMRIASKHKYGWDTVEYRLNFMPVSATEAEGKETVLSVARIEDVFGQLKPTHGTA